MMFTACQPCVTATRPPAQAEARRRLRINERLEALRQLVPHTERANTANFLEEVVQYVQRLQVRHRGCRGKPLGSCFGVLHRGISA
jgi:hypothetical protein